MTQDLRGCGLPVQRLAEITDLGVALDSTSCRAAQQDFGGLLVGEALAQVRPVTIEALVALLGLARDEGFTLTLRGSGCSPGGQSLPAGGCSLDLSGLAGVAVDPHERKVRCGGGATWRAVLAATAAHALAPAVMPANLDLTVGGTLAAGGIGSTSHRSGMAVCCVMGLTVVLGTGDCVHASINERREVYNAVLGGIGHFGVIVEAELELRPLLPRIQTFYLLYDDIVSFLGDQRRLTQERWCHHLEGFAVSATLGMRRNESGRRVSFARWFYGLQVSVEHMPGEEPSAASCLDGLGHRELVHAESNEGVAFAARADARFEMMRMTGAWHQPHPWLEYFLPFESAVTLLPRLLDQLPLFLGDGHRIMVLADRPRPSLLMLPAGAPVVAFTIQPAGVTAPLQAQSLTSLHAVEQVLIAAGGKRYLGGWQFSRDEAAWRDHYGPHFDSWLAHKQALDPNQIFTSLPLPMRR